MQGLDAAASMIPMFAPDAPIEKIMEKLKPIVEKSSAIGLSRRDPGSKVWRLAIGIELV